MAAPLSIIEGQIDDWYSTRRYEEFTVTIAAPGVITKDYHGLETNDRVKLFTTGALPTGFSSDTFYYVIRLTDHTFKLSSTRDGSAITTSGSQSGTHYFAKDGANRITPTQESNK